MKKFLLLMVLAFALTACGNGAAGTNDVGGDVTTLRIGATPTPHAVVLEFIADDLAARGVVLDIVEFAEFVLMNQALYEGQIDVNYFQHYPFLLNWIENSGNVLTRVADIHIEPMGVYSETLTHVHQVPPGGSVAIPNDAVNGGRALTLLEAAGLLVLPEENDGRITVADIVENLLDLNIIELEAPLVPVALPEVDIAVINTNFALGIGLNPIQDAIFMEDVDSPFANIVVTRPENANDEAIRILVETLQTDRVREFIIERFENAVVPVF